MKILGYLASPALTVVLLVLIGVVAACGSFLPAARAGALFGSGTFAVIIAFLFLNILIGLITSSQRGSAEIRFILIRTGALLVLLGAFLGSFLGQRGYIQLYEGQKTGEFTTKDGPPLAPGFVLRLDRFSVERYPEGALELGISAGSDAGLRIYPAALGLWTGPEEMRVLPLRYLPDFKITADGDIISASPNPNNPALEVEVEAGGEKEKGWLFARFPHFPPVGLSRTLRAGRIVFFDRRSEKIKSYRSEVTILEDDSPAASGTVEVNRPFRFKGYRIYQSKYDPVGWQWSGLELVRDPGLPLVYCGFIFLAVGITLWVSMGRFD